MPLFNHLSLLPHTAGKTEQGKTILNVGRILGCSPGRVSWCSARWALGEARWEGSDRAYGCLQMARSRNFVWPSDQNHSSTVSAIELLLTLQQMEARASLILLMCFSFSWVLSEHCLLGVFRFYRNLHQYKDGDGFPFPFSLREKKYWIVCVFLEPMSSFLLVCPPTFPISFSPFLLSLSPVLGIQTRVSTTLPYPRHTLSPRPFSIVCFVLFLSFSVCRPGCVGSVST